MLLYCTSSTLESSITRDRLWCSLHASQRSWKGLRQLLSVNHLWLLCGVPGRPPLLRCSAQWLAEMISAWKPASPSLPALCSQKVLELWVFAARLLRAVAYSEVALSIPVQCSSSLQHHNAVKQLKVACASSFTFEWQLCSHMLVQHPTNANTQLCQHCQWQALSIATECHHWHQRLPSPHCLQLSCHASAAQSAPSGTGGPEGAIT